MNEGQKRRKRKREEEEKQEKEKWTKEQGWGRRLLLLVLLLFLAPRLRLRRSRPAGPPQRATRGPSRPGPRAGQPSTTPVGSRPGPRGGRLRRLPGRRREREQGKKTGTGLGVFFLGGCWGEKREERANEFFFFFAFLLPPARPSFVRFALFAARSLFLSLPAQLRMKKNSPLAPSAQLTELTTSSRGSQSERRRATEQAPWRRTRGLNADAGGGGRMAIGENKLMKGRRQHRLDN